ncbi:MAG: RdgB/HAM1 family non-canonical purine NTP pyrophosphatase [Flammeovirgaceae bacterium]|nr:RdgB/HAM1 family non-canonical purine NTP pyrophosphatase [Flammeovirgaceae bacterium]
MKLCFATNNPHKLDEARAILNNHCEIVSLHDIGCNQELAEDFDTLEKNSLQKAQFIHDHYQIDCFADDTGLEVEALNGAPGVYSARYSGLPPDSEKNVSLLLENLHDVKNRKARFRTVIALILEGNEYFFEGILSGTILKTRKGIQGFGYDPVFLPDGHDQTLAEMTASEKNAMSHRARALLKVVAFLGDQKSVKP